MSLVLAHGDFTPKPLEQVAAAEGHAGIGGQGFEKPEVGPSKPSWRNGRSARSR